MEMESLAPYDLHGNLLPPDSTLVGLAALAHNLKIQAPLKTPLNAVSARHVKGGIRNHGNWRLYDRRYKPNPTFADHIAFAFRHENFDPLVIKRIFEATPANEIKALVQAQPSGAIARRIWFFYETLLGVELDIPDAGAVPAADALDKVKYVVTKPKLSRRHRVRDNLLGTGDYLPVVRRTKAINQFLEKGLEAKAREITGSTGAHVLRRAASFLLLADSRASFEIEGERPPRSRLERWGRAVMQGGKNPLTMDELVRLQSVLIEEDRFIHKGLRGTGVFLGERDHLGDPLPEFIGARPDDIEALLSGLVAANDRMRTSDVHPVVQAAATAFGFVYIHPFEDGNGRVHRCLIHHVLADRRFSPPGLVFPVSSVMLDRIDDYRNTLQGHSAPLMGFIEWRPTPDRNIFVLNDTADLYKYFDVTAEAEFLFSCVARTIEEDLPREIDYLQRHDRARKRIMDRVEMPDRLVENLIMFVRQNGGHLSDKRRKKEFAALKDEELRDLERIIADAFKSAPFPEREKVEASEAE